jgi:hypothetical protein
MSAGYDNLFKPKPIPNTKSKGANITTYASMVGLKPVSVGVSKNPVNSGTKAKAMADTEVSNMAKAIHEKEERNNLFSPVTVAKSILSILVLLKLLLSI